MLKAAIILVGVYHSQAIPVFYRRAKHRLEFAEISEILTLDKHLIVEYRQPSHELGGLTKYCHLADYERIA